MTDHKAARFRLYPTPGQGLRMAQIAGACRFVDNPILEQWWIQYRVGCMIRA